MECLKCGELVKPVEGIVNESKDLAWIYRCKCGWKWVIWKKPEVRVSEIGRRDRPNW